MIACRVVVLEFSPDVVESGDMTLTNTNLRNSELQRCHKTHADECMRREKLNCDTIHNIHEEKQGVRDDNGQNTQAGVTSSLKRIDEELVTHEMSLCTM